MTSRAQKCISSYNKMMANYPSHQDVCELEEIKAEQLVTLFQNIFRHRSKKQGSIEDRLKYSMKLLERQIELTLDHIPVSKLLLCDSESIINVIEILELVWSMKETMRKQEDVKDTFEETESFIREVNELESSWNDEPAVLLNSFKPGSEKESDASPYSKSVPEKKYLPMKKLKLKSNRTPKKKHPKPNGDDQDPLTSIKQFITNRLPGIEFPRYLNLRLRQDALRKTRFTQQEHHRQRILSQRQEKQFLNTSELHAIGNQIKKEYDHFLHREQRKSVEQAKRVQANSLKERKRAIVRMTKYQDEINQALARKEQKKLAMEEGLLGKLVKELETSEKMILLEKSQLEKEKQKEIKEKMTLKRQGLEKFWKDQCDILKEEIHEMQLQWKIAEKAKTRELERTYREQKGKIKTQLELYRDQIDQDQNDLYFREKDIENIRNEFIRLAVRK